MRVDSAFYGPGSARGDPRRSRCVGDGAPTETVKTAIADIDDSAWTPIEYTDAVYDENTGTWISRAEVAEIDFTAFASRRRASRLRGG